MSSRATRDSTPWFRQAESDARTAEALLGTPRPMQEADVGCHVAALCAQALEKSLKGYLILNGVEPAMDHRPDKYLRGLLTPGDPSLRYEGHRRWLSALFDAETSGAVRLLFDLTPGGLGRSAETANTEYPWRDLGRWRHAPWGGPTFADRATVGAWVRTARRVCDTLFKLWAAVDRSTL